jgi:hypothetical protein
VTRNSAVSIPIRWPRSKDRPLQQLQEDKEPDGVPHQERERIEDRLQVGSACPGQKVAAVADAMARLSCSVAGVAL